MKRGVFTILFAKERFCCKAPMDACARAIADAMTEYRPGRFVRFDPARLWFGRRTRHGYRVWRRVHLGYEVDILLSGEGPFTVISLRPTPPLGLASILLFGPLLVIPRVSVLLAVVWGLLASLVFVMRYWSIQAMLSEICSVLPKVVTCGRCGYDLRATPERCPECGDVASPA